MVPGFNVAGGLPPSCDITVLTPITRLGQPRSGTRSKGGSLLTQAERDNYNTYQLVIGSGFGAL